jgi:hypothetical protein
MATEAHGKIIDYKKHPDLFPLPDPLPVGEGFIIFLSVCFRDNNIYLYPAELSNTVFSRIL